MSETTPPTSGPEPAPIHNAEAKAVALLALLVALVLGAVMYLMYARGAFEPTQRLVLTADDSEGVAVGMDVTFAGFPIGACSASNWRRTARRASWSTCRARTRTGCAPPASSPWKRAWWAAPSCAPSPASRPTRRCRRTPNARCWWATWPLKSRACCNRPRTC